MLSNDWFYEEFGFDESELKNGKAITNFFVIDDENTKFNIFTSRTSKKSFYAGRFDCLTNNELEQMLNQLRNGSSQLKLGDFCYDKANTKKKSETLTEEHQKKKVKIEDSSHNELAVSPQKDPMKMGPKLQNVPQKALNPNEIKEDNNLEEEKSDPHEKEAEFRKELHKGLIFGNKENIAVKSLIYQNKNKDAVFQVASQFNCLEMVGPSITPSHGITNYILDQTQGPECALCCRSALLYRNYLYDFGQGHRGQLKSQINLLDEVEKYVDNEKNKFWYIDRKSVV